MKFSIAQDNLLIQSNNQNNQEYYLQKANLSVHFHNTTKKLPNFDRQYEKTKHKHNICVKKIYDNTAI